KGRLLRGLCGGVSGIYRRYMKGVELVQQVAFRFLTWRLELPLWGGRGVLLLLYIGLCWSAAGCAWWRVFGLYKLFTNSA
ncbi:MAG: hypothetical protein OIF38_08235, partial [Cellvibrionaceae bacterium]|nr:hypothetical protein [Cellvibrionaceae bacterium]